MAKYKICRPDTLIKQIKAVMEKENQPMFPVVHRVTEVYLGCVTREDVVQYYKEFPDTGKEKVIDVLTWNVKRGLPRLFCVHDWDEVKTATNVIKANNLKFVPVITISGLYKGTVDRSD